MKFVMLVLIVLGNFQGFPAHAANATAPTGAKIARMWHGQVPNAKAMEYRAYISDAIKKFKTIPGNKGYTLFMEKRGDVTHFLVTSFWDSKKSIEAYAGKDITKTHFLPKDKDYLKDPEETVMNYDIEIADLQ